MNRRGFTLIELLAVIIILGLTLVIIVPNIFEMIAESREVSYSTLVQNIVTSSQMYYEECEYGDLSDTSKYGTYACSITSNTITTTLGTLANTGFLTVSDIKEVEGKEIKAVINPTNNKDISDCQIQIKKVVTTSTDVNGIENYKVTYEITASGEDCPTSEEYKGE